MDVDIKDYREKELRNYIIGNLLLCFVGMGRLGDITVAIGLEKLWDSISMLLSTGFVGALIYIYVFLADSLIPANVKNIIIWGTKGLPGNRIFSDIYQNNKDIRFTSEMVMTRYKEVYSSIKEVRDKEKRNIENVAWYKAYQRNENNPSIYVSNRDWLLCRDMCVMTIFIILGFVIVSICYIGRISGFMIAIYLIELVLTWIAARTKGKQFVYNVIAKDVYLID